MLYQSTTTEWNGGEAEGLTDEAKVTIINDMVTLAQKENDFLSTLNRSRNTIAAYKWALHAFNNAVGPKAQLTMDNYILFLRSLHDLSPSTQRSYRTAVRELYDFCNAGDDREMRRQEKHYISREGSRFPNPDMKRIEKFIAYCDTMRGDLRQLRDRAFVLTLADTGLRISEAIALKRGQIDWDRERLVIVGKGNKQAVVRLSERVLAAIKDYFNARAKLDGATGKPLGSLPVFARHDRRGHKRVLPTTKRGMWGSIKGIVVKGTTIQKGRMREAGIDRSVIRIHDLRHYFVTRILEQTGNLKLAQELARHSQIGTTQRYAHLTNQQLDAAYDEVFNPAPKEQP